MRIESRILVVRGQKVMIDTDLADIYGVPTKRLNEQIRRNRDRFPPDFMFQLSTVEKAEVVANCDHLEKLKFSKTPPFAFTEHGAMMAGFVLNSLQAVEMSVYVVRAFARLREVLASNKEMAARMERLERSTEALALRHDELAINTRAQLRQVLDAVRELMAPPAVPVKRPIGFIVAEDKPLKPKAAPRRR